MAERPKWFKGVVEGGKKEDLPAGGPKSKPSSIEVVPADTPRKEHSGQSEDNMGSEESRGSDLVLLYLKLSRKPPANFVASVRPERVQEAAKILSSWSVDVLHGYLSGSEVWKRPSFTKAVFEEIRARMLLGSMSPRE